VTILCHSGSRKRTGAVRCESRVPPLVVMLVALQGGSMMGRSIASAGENSTSPVSRELYVLDAVEGNELQVMDAGKGEHIFLAGLVAPDRLTPAAKAALVALREATFARTVSGRCVRAPSLAPKKPGGKPIPGALYCVVERDGTDVAVALLTTGNAKFSEKKAFGLTPADKDRYRAAESKAKQAQNGVSTP